MTRDEAERLLRLSRDLRWTFPTSFGRPVRREGDEWAESLPEWRHAFSDAAGLLDTEAATELAANVWRVWVLARDDGAGRAFLSSVLDRPAAGPLRHRALALYGDALLALRQGAHEDSRARSAAALDAARRSGDAEALALAHLGAGRVAFDDGDYERARTLAAEASEHANGLEPALGQAPLHLRAQAARMCGDYDEAAALFEQSLALNRRIGDVGMVAVELHNLGHVELHRGNVDAATRCFAESAEDETGDDPYGAALVDLNAAAIAFARGDAQAARALLDRTESLLERTELASDDRFELDWLRSRV